MRITANQGNTEMKITIKHMIVAASLVMGAQAQAAGFGAMNGAGLPAEGAAQTCMGANGHPGAEDASGCVAVRDSQRPTPRYSVS